MYMYTIIINNTTIIIVYTTLTKQLTIKNTTKMGNNPPQSQNIKQIQTQVLRQANKVVQQLKLFNSEQQLREQRHLFARILIFGHSNLIAHLKVFPRDRQKQIVRQLKIDYQTTDLLYKNLVVNQIKAKEKGVRYSQFLGILDKKKEERENNSKYRLAIEQGIQVLNSKKVAIMLFAGGNSSRFKTKENKMLQKQLYKQKQDQKCLLQISLDKISTLYTAYPDLSIYLVHNEQNHSQVNSIVLKYSHLKIKKLIQNQSPIVNLSGRMCLKSKQGFQILTMPRGCGDLASLSVKGIRLFQQMESNGIEYVCAVGVENICAIIADPYLIGVLAMNINVSVAFKCTYPNSQDQNLKRLTFNKTHKHIQATQLQTLLQTSHKQSNQTLKRSPVWINNVAFKLPHIKRYLEQKKQDQKLPQIFSAKKIQCTYWNPITSQYEQQQHCYMFQRQLNNLLLNQELKCIGVMVQRENQFVPVFTRDGEWNWGDAYNQYLYQQRQDNTKIARHTSHENYFSVVAASDQSQF